MVDSSRHAQGFGIGRWKREDTPIFHGRCAVEVDFESDDAKYVTLIFPREMDSALVTQYVIDIKEQKPAKADTTTPDSSPEIPKSPDP